VDRTGVDKVVDMFAVLGFQVKSNNEAREHMKLDKMVGNMAEDTWKVPDIGRLASAQALIAF